MNSQETRRRKKGKNQQEPEEVEEKTMWQKAMIQGAAWDKETFEEFLDVVYWLRQVVALVLGLVWGLVPLTGLPAIISFAGVNYLSVWAYYAKYVGVDEDEWGRGDLAKEGFQASAGVFMLAWIITYTTVHQGGLNVL
uniref:Rab5-interacting protein n=1 Tax=Fibrocapsa japonica TaxID=94617 RepID=A0A7S2V656_9STRA|mmetsp:Transcript_4813/g.7220  ORF Transcript_4813/g.7220 Transcript_4813/m.7220 type:complete len:138 (+) Transcript_4813:106-519(+)|eukprot:CAMPEP_0113945026 /NCGR_PEP_ID=MMETSP1339-20121228/38440_1 /TAXON_ID=94617 /ORGANISM="Fibrocapsa japonica" /LENGTH=137 /DNA_ID=CAMNT_0000950415 /DNA_START=103 /DNA_END=516 /DNA_ORIENTATION=- /assembly_acc=CAM_ASM_000762